VITLDSFIRDRGLTKVDLIKIDTEGTEPQVLRGMGETLRRDRPTIICEVLKGFGTERELQEMLCHYGYRYYLLTRDGPTLRETIEGQPDDRWELRNYLFTTLGPDEVAQL
jgi:hypothetical protein